MNPAIDKLQALHSASMRIDAANRRVIVENELYPTLEDLKSDWKSFTFEREAFFRQVDTATIWAKEIWKTRDCEMKVGKFQSELQKLQSRLLQ